MATATASMNTGLMTSPQASNNTPANLPANGSGSTALANAPGANGNGTTNATSVGGMLSPWRTQGMADTFKTVINQPAVRKVLPLIIMLAAASGAVIGIAQIVLRGGAWFGADWPLLANGTGAVRRFTAPPQWQPASAGSGAGDVALLMVALSSDGCGSRADLPSRADNARSREPAIHVSPRRGSGALAWSRTCTRRGAASPR